MMSSAAAFVSFVRIKKTQREGATLEMLIESKYKIIWKKKSQVQLNSETNVTASYFLKFDLNYYSYTSANKLAKLDLQSHQIPLIKDRFTGKKGLRSYLNARRQ